MIQKSKDVTLKTNKAHKIILLSILQMWAIQRISVMMKSIEIPSQSVLVINFAGTQQIIL